MQSVALIDYGSGNLRSAEKALVRAAAGTADIVVTNDPETVRGADRIVLPGVGAFAACMTALGERTGVIEAMNEAVRGRGVPFLGICVGMQLLADRGLAGCALRRGHGRNLVSLLLFVRPVAQLG